MVEAVGVVVEAEAVEAVTVADPRVESVFRQSPQFGIRLWFYGRQSYRDSADRAIEQVSEVL